MHRSRIGYSPFPPRPRDEGVGSGEFIPHFLIKKYPGINFGFHRRVRRYITHDMKIRDVCGKCNNGPLSALDHYGAEFHSVNCCGTRLRSNERVAVTKTLSPQQDSAPIVVSPLTMRDRQGVLFAEQVEAWDEYQGGLE